MGIEQQKTMLSAAEQERRRQAVAVGLAQVRLEGLEPDEIFFTYTDRYIRGELTLDAAIVAYMQHVAKSQLNEVRGACDTDDRAPTPTES